MEPKILSISSNASNVRQDIYPLDQWTITTRKGIILQSKCTCHRANDQQDQASKKEIGTSDKLCNLCKYAQSLPQLHSMPDMLFNDNLLKLEHYTGVGIEFTPLDALKLVKETKDPLQVAVADGWQSARADFPFAKSVLKPFDWTFTTDYQGTLLAAKKTKPSLVNMGPMPRDCSSKTPFSENKSTKDGSSTTDITPQSQDEQQSDNQVHLVAEKTDERIDVNKLKVREEILFYDDVTLYEDELADHGTAQYSVKVRVMPRSLFILARFYLRVDGVLARINDTRIYHELNKKYLLREYTNREAKLNSLNLPVSTLVNPNELVNYLPLIQSSYEKLSVPRVR